MAEKTRRPKPGRGARRAGVVPCWLCGTRLHSAKMMPDGGDACDDIRWYCLSTRACTQRWTASRNFPGGQKAYGGATVAGPIAPERVEQAPVMPVPVAHVPLAIEDRAAENPAQVRG